MKRILGLFILCWVVCCISSAHAVALQPQPLTFANAATSATPLLDKIVAATASPTIKTIARSSGVVGMPLINTIIAASEGNVPAVVGNLLTIPVYVYATPAAGVAASLAVGYLTNSEFDLKSAYDNGWLQSHPLLAEILGQKYPATAPSEPYSIGYDMDCSSAGTTLCPSGTVARVTGSAGYQRIGPYFFEVGAQEACNIYNSQSSSKYFVHASVIEISGSWYVNYYQYPVSYISGTPTLHGAPVSLPSADIPNLAARIVAATLANPAVKTALNDLAKAHPQVIPTPQPITQTDINNWATTNNYTTNQTYIDNLTNLANTYPENVDIKIALEAAKAEQAKEEAEKAAETYEPLSPSGFDPAYNPGEFDIPARFTSFIDNVKSSPLFSFSNSFFNSLPGGGSPIYEIEAGQYGHHSVDLSLTMSVGLAVLKIIMLAIFGFLSIRAVIMKR